MDPARKIGGEERIDGERAVRSAMTLEYLTQELAVGKHRSPKNYSSGVVRLATSNGKSPRGHAKRGQA
ncbi:hypothetical protein A5N78_17940 [Prescottella equi]|jgi:hypothetical protein|nr:hypothetical protein A6F59_13620 [Prescottella equi]ORL87283.1 hypothetical protein A5N78_17940 [Prescottella equi]ORM15395.1 hypothetical protein A5N70_16925 [Prescottella equi]